MVLLRSTAFFKRFISEGKKKNSEQAPPSVGLDFVKIFLTHMMVGGRVKRILGHFSSSVENDPCLANEVCCNDEVRNKLESTEAFRSVGWRPKR